MYGKAAVIVFLPALPVFAFPHARAKITTRLLNVHVRIKQMLQSLKLPKLKQKSLHMLCSRVLVAALDEMSLIDVGVAFHV